MLVTGHSLGGAIAQITAYAFGLDGSAIDPGAAQRIVQTAGFLGAAADLGLVPTNFGAAASFTNYLVAGSAVSNGTGPHIGGTSAVPSLTFSGGQALTAFLVSLVNPVAGFAYVVGTDQFSNKHASTQISQALSLLAGAPQSGQSSEAVKLVAKETGTTTDPRTGEVKPTYSQTEFEIRDAATGTLQSTVKFSGSGADRKIEVFDGATGGLKSTTTLAATGAITVQPVTGSSIVIGYLPAVNNNQDGTVTVIAKDVRGDVLSTKNIQTFDDGSTFSTTTFPSGRVEQFASDVNGAPASQTITTPTPGGNPQREAYIFINGQRVAQSRTYTEYFYDDNGVSRIETVTTAAGTIKNVYNNDNTLFSSEPVRGAGLDQFTLTQAGGTALDLISLGNNGRAPDGYRIASGAVLLNRYFNAPDPVTGLYTYPNFNSAAQIAQGALSLYSLDIAFKTSGNELGKAYALGSTINFVNQTLFDGASKALVNSGAGQVNSFLNGSGGTPGFLGYLGLLSAIQKGDPVGIVQGLGPLIWGNAFTPWGIGLALVSIIFAPSPPKAWGVANVTYGDGFDNLNLNLTLKVNATGDSFGTERARQGLQYSINYLQTQVVDTLNATHDASHQLGLIAQRMPALAWRANDAGDKGYRLTDIDPLTGEQKYPYRRFDDAGIPFSSNPRAYEVDPSDPNQRGALAQNLVMSAYNRQAIAPLWEVKTAKLQGDAGAVNAGLSEEERAAKAGYNAALDSAYAASHSQDATARNKRLVQVSEYFNLNTVTSKTVANYIYTTGAMPLNRQVKRVVANDPVWEKAA